MIVGAIWWCWCTPAAAAVGVCRGVTTLPLLPTSAVRLCGHLRRQGSGPCLCLRQPRRHRQQWLAPAGAAVGVGGGGATTPAPLQCRRRQWRDLPHASTGVRAGPGRRLPSGSATLSDEQSTPLQTNLCVQLHFKRDSAAGRSACSQATCHMTDIHCHISGL